MSTTPKTLESLRYEENVVSRTANGESVESAANRFFHELFDPAAKVHINLLFEEDGKKVYEAYQDAGSVDYLYIIKGGKHTYSSPN